MTATALNIEASGAQSPAQDAEAVTPHDSTDLTHYCRALYVGTGGDVAVVTAKNGNVVTFVNVPSGSILPVRASRVNSTNTTATDIVALY